MEPNTIYLLRVDLIESFDSVFEAREYHEAKCVKILIDCYFQVIVSR